MDVVFGTYRIRDEAVLEAMIAHAASQGVRLIDSARLYRTESLALRAARRHKDLSVGTKIHECYLPGVTLDLVKRSFEENGSVPLGRVLLHRPLPMHMWRELEEAHRRGYTREIGVSNVDVRTLQALVEVATVPPAVVQAEFHAFLKGMASTRALLLYCRQRGIRFEAHSVLGGRRRVQSKRAAAASENTVGGVTTALSTVGTESTASSATMGGRIGVNGGVEVVAGSSPSVEEAASHPDTTVEAVAAALGWTPGRTAQELVRWARVALTHEPEHESEHGPKPTAAAVSSVAAGGLALCLKASTPARLDELLAAARDPDVSREGVKDLSHVLTSFRLYPVPADNLLLDSIARSGGGGGGEVPLTVMDMHAKLQGPEGASPEAVARAMAYVRGDSAALLGGAIREEGEKGQKPSLTQELIGELQHNGTKTTTAIGEEGEKGAAEEDQPRVELPVVGVALHLEKHRALLTRVAVEMLGDAEARDVLTREFPWGQHEEEEKEEEEDARKLWGRHPCINSSVSRLKSLLKRMRAAMDERAKAKAASNGGSGSGRHTSCKLVRVEVASAGEVPDLVQHPVAMPVDVPAYAQLEPFFEYVSRLEEAPESDVVFRRGALLAGGHVDMCKQVVGPAHLGRLCDAVLSSKVGAIRHFLLGNNVAFDDPSTVQGPGRAEASSETREAGIAKMVELMERANPSDGGIETWYLAGNVIDGAVMERFAAVLASSAACKSLWLKRNPLGPRGARAIGRMLARNAAIEVLDLHNTGLLDQGMEAMTEELDAHPPTASALRHIHLGANGISPRGAQALTRVLRHLSPRLETLYLDMNHLGDAGLDVLVPVLLDCQRLKRFILCANGLTDVGLLTVEALAMRLPDLTSLGVGFYKSTGVLGAPFNSFTDAAPLVRLLQGKPSLQLLKAERCGLGEAATRELVEAARARDDVSLFALQQEGHDAGENVVVHDGEELYAMRNPDLVDHIYSIYRNNM